MVGYTTGQNRLWVYGSLKKGMPADYLLKDCVKIEEAQMQGIMIHCSGFPGFISDWGGMQIKGEIYEIPNNEVWEKLDAYEGTPTLFKRQVHYLNNKATCYYSYQRSGGVNPAGHICREWLGEGTSTPKIQYSGATFIMPDRKADTTELIMYHNRVTGWRGLVDLMTGDVISSSQNEKPHFRWDASLRVWVQTPPANKHALVSLPERSYSGGDRRPVSTLPPYQQHHPSHIRPFVPLPKRPDYIDKKDPGEISVKDARKQA